VAQGHPLGARTRITLADAATEPWIVGTPGTTYHQLVLAACMTAGFTPHIVHYADEWDTGTALVAHGFGVILVPRLARLREDSPVTRVPLVGEPAPARRIVAVTRAGAGANPTASRAIATITRTAARLLPPRPPATNGARTA
jgi:DNA-binding transcriptional LysR family regulator